MKKEKETDRVILLFVKTLPTVIADWNFTIVVKGPPSKAFYVYTRSFQNFYKIIINIVFCFGLNLKPYAYTRRKQREAKSGK